MDAQTNTVNHTKHNEHLKIYFLFDRLLKEAFVKNEDGQKTISSYKNIVGKDSVVARVFKASDPVTENPDIQSNLENFIGKPEKLESDTVTYNEKSRVFVAERYGFVVLKNKKLEVLPLITVSPDRLKAFIFIAKKIDKSMPTAQEIREVASASKILHIIENGAITEEIDKSDVGRKILIARGMEPTSGHTEFIELNRKEKNEVGKEVEGGRIDYKEKDNLFLVKKDDVVASKTEAIEPQDGYDIFGNTIEGEIEGKNNYYIGRNISEKDGEPNIYVSDIDGGVSIEKDGEIYVEERIVIEGDINIETGNIHFNGFVEIKGNITSGFTVDTGKDLIVRGNIEDASVNSQGSVCVENGVLGEKTSVYAKNNIFAKFVQSASIKSDKSINIAVSIVQGNCLAKEYINVEGKVVGGNIHGYLGVNVGSIGSLSGTRTVIETSYDNTKENMSPQMKEKLQRIKKLTEEINSSYGKDAYKTLPLLVKTLPENRKKHLLSIIKQIKELQNEIKQEKEKGGQTESEDAQEGKESSIIINQKVYAGAIIKINHTSKKIEKTINMATTYTESSLLREKK